MRTVFYLVCSAFVIGLAYWAYKENYRTQAALREVKELQQQIAQEKVTIAVLKAEWAYLNRPDRLRELVDLNFTDLKLIPLLPSHFGDSEMVSYPTEALQDIDEPVSVIANDPSNGRVFP
jgi:cell division protein FtsL